MTSRLPTWAKLKEQLEKQDPAIPRPEDCEICQEEFDREHPVVLPCPSKHVFGLACLLRWFTMNDTYGNQRNTCPKCRLQVFEGARATDQHFRSLMSGLSSLEVLAEAAQRYGETRSSEALAPRASLGLSGYIHNRITYEEMEEYRMSRVSGTYQSSHR